MLVKPLKDKYSARSFTIDKTLGNVTCLLGRLQLNVRWKFLVQKLKVVQIERGYPLTHSCCISSHWEYCVLAWMRWCFISSAGVS